MLEEQGNSINIDCVDPLGRTALLMGIDNENLEMVELLLDHKVQKNANIVTPSRFLQMCHM